MQPGNFLAPLGQKWEGHTKNFTGLADGEILLHMEPVALLHKYDLLDEGILPADLASHSSKWPEEEGARHCKREWKIFFDQINKFGEWGCEDGWHNPRAKFSI
jgi:hypothetical protein